MVHVDQNQRAGQCGAPRPTDPAAAWGAPHGGKVVALPCPLPLQLAVVLAGSADAARALLEGGCSAYAVSQTLSAARKALAAEARGEATGVRFGTVGGLDGIRECIGVLEAALAGPRLEDRT